jgi:predicted nucleotidyltransferase
MGGIEAVDPWYGPLLERAREVLGEDDRVLSVGAGGSVGAGTADPWSDLDLAIVTDPGHHDDFIREWPLWVRRITPTVFARTPIAPFIVNTITEDGLTVDFVIWSGGFRTCSGC